VVTPSSSIPVVAASSADTCGAITPIIVFLGIAGGFAACLASPAMGNCPEGGGAGNGKLMAPDICRSAISSMCFIAERTAPAMSRRPPGSGVDLTAASTASANAPASGKRSNGERARQRRKTLSSGLGKAGSGG
jgi:hypothetical protein